MEVTRENFDELLPSILEAIERCTFISVDAELTGLHLTDEKENYFDSVSERYRLLRQSASNFLLVQFGMVLFFYHPESDTFTHRAYNFYLFPKQIPGSNSPNVRFTCEASSLEFLASWGFDFNKLIYKGIPYLTLEVEQKLKENYTKKQIYLREENSTPCPVPENLKAFMTETQGKIKALLSGQGEELFLEELSPFQRKLVFNNIKPKYNSLYFETIVKEQEVVAGGGSGGDSESSDNERTPTTPSTSRSCRVLRVAKMTEEERMSRDLEKKRQVFETIDKGIGFSKVVRKISETGKIVVGHNMILDVAHSVHQFVTDLPEDLEGFKSVVQSAFPNLVDTKLMCCTHPFRELFQSSVLGDVLKRVQEEPFELPRIEKEEDCQVLSYQLEDGKQHEAGYDAFITGVCFVGLCQYLGQLQVPKKPRVLPESPLVLPFLNKLYLMRMLDISYLNISGTDLTPSRDHVFHVTCPKEATTKSVVNLFGAFGQVQVWWQDDNHLFVSLNDKSQAGFVMKNIDIEKGKGWRVVPFKQWQSAREKGKRKLNERKMKGLGRKKNNSESSSSSASSGSSGQSEDRSPPGGGDVNHQKKKRPKTELELGKKQGDNNNGGKGKGGKSKTHFDEPSTWD